MTPETDKLRDDIWKKPEVGGSDFAAMFEHSRKLERERDEARETVKSLTMTSFDLLAALEKARDERDEAVAEATNAVNDIIGIRWKLNSLVEACQNLIDVQGRHNTEIAFNKMKSILESITNQTNEMGRL